MGLGEIPRADNLYAAPGNGGTDSVAQNVAGLNVEDGKAVLAFVKGNAIDMVVIGPEAPLVAGVADVLREAGIAVFGPDAQGAQLEGNKTFSKGVHGGQRHPHGSLWKLHRAGTGA